MHKSSLSGQSSDRSGDAAPAVQGSVSGQHAHSADYVAAARSVGNNQKVALAVFVIGLLVGIACAVHDIYFAVTNYLLDVGVFRDAGRAFNEGLPLYSEGFPTRSGFRFIYPPFAALLFAPLMWMGENTMEVVWTLATIAAVFGIVGMAVKKLGLRPWWMWSIGLAGLALAIDPIRENMGFGQINVFLILLVAMDVLGFTPKRIRGIGIGIAAGIKITPAAFAVIFLVRKDWVAVAQSAGFFVLTAVIGWLVRAEESVYFWTTEFFISDRGGPPPYPPNQAMTGLISRAGTSDEFAQAVMKPGFLIIAGLAIFAAWQLEKAGRRVDSLMVIILAVVLATPVAVSHHWSGMVLLLPLLFRPLNRTFAWLIGLLILAVTAGLYTVYLPEQRHYDFAFPEWFIGNSMGLMGLVLWAAYVVWAVRSLMLQLRKGSSAQGSAGQGHAEGQSGKGGSAQDPSRPATNTSEATKQSRTSLAKKMFPTTALAATAPLPAGSPLASAVRSTRTLVAGALLTTSALLAACAPITDGDPSSTSATHGASQQPEHDAHQQQQTSEQEEATSSQDSRLATPTAQPDEDTKAADEWDEGASGERGQADDQHAATVWANVIGVTGMPTTQVWEQWETLAVKGRAPKTGYSRDQFGQRWKDIDRNGCDQRNDILARDLTQVNAPNGCKVLSGQLLDPFTGQSINFQRGQDTSRAVQIDHIVAMSDAWQKGAQDWSAEKREQFANDPLNLLAVDGPQNQKKKDSDAATWLPPNTAYRCQYAATQIRVKHDYGLWVTAAEKDALARELGRCGQTIR